MGSISHGDGHSALLKTCSVVVFLPRGSKCQNLVSLVPSTIKAMAFGTRNLKSWVLGPSGSGAPRSDKHRDPAFWFEG